MSVFTARLHVMQRTARESRLLSVCPSVRPSVRRTRGLWQNERKFCPHSYTTWMTIHPSFLTTLLHEILRQTDPAGAKTPIFQSTFTRIASAVTLSEKGQLTPIGSPLRAFQWVWDEHRTLPPPPSHPLKRAQKRDTAVFSVKLHFTGKSMLQSFFVWILPATKL